MDSKTTNDERRYSASILVPLVEILRERGFAAERILHGTCLSPEALLRPTTITFADFLQVHTNAIDLVPEPNFGFQVGTRYHLSSYGVFGYAVLSSTSVRKAVELIFSYSNTVEPAIEQKFMENRDKKVCLITMDPLLGPGDRPGLYKFFVDRYMGQIFAALRDVIGDAFVPSALLFTYSRDIIGPHAHIDLTGCDIVYGAAKNRFIFDAAWLDRSIEFGNSVTHAALVDLCNSILAEFNERLGFSGRVRSLLMENSARRLDIADACAALGMSERTLRRRLAEEGYSYARIVDELRMKVALKYLRDSSLKVSAIADTLGFSDPGTFRRALLRWTGKTPQQVRSEFA